VKGTGVKQVSWIHLREPVEEKLEELSAKLSSPYWRKQTLAKAQRALEKLLDSSAGKLYETQLQAAPGDKGWSLEWSLSQSKLGRVESLDGYYTLLTNVPQDQADLLQIFRYYKAQTHIERRFLEWKGPLKLRPVFLKSNKRIEGLVLILSVALRICSLLEQQVRQQMRSTTAVAKEDVEHTKPFGPSEPDKARKAARASERLVALYPEGRAAKPTGRNNLHAWFLSGPISIRWANPPAVLQELLQGMPQGP
jgi:hypothetical protein